MNAIIANILATVLGQIVPTLVNAIMALIRDWLASELDDADQLPDVIRNIVAGINRDHPDWSDDEKWDEAVGAVDAHLAAVGRAISDNLRNRLVELAVGEAQQPEVVG